MNLETLNRHDPATARSILGSASLTLGTREYRSLRDPQLADEVEALLREVRAGLGLADGDNSDRAVAAIGKVVSRELTTAAMAGHDFDAVVERMGTQGRLPLSAYKVTLPSSETRLFKESPKYITKALQSPDEVFQYSPRDISEDEIASRGVSLYLKKQNEGKRNEHWLLAHANRLGSTLEVIAINRIFPQVIDLSVIDSLTSMLAAFVEHYGLAFSIPGVSGPSKFLHDYALPADLPDAPEVTPKPEVHESRDYRYVESGVVVYDKGDDGKANNIVDRRIVFAYATDVDKYISDKTRYG